MWVLNGFDMSTKQKGGMPQVRPEIPCLIATKGCENWMVSHVVLDS